MTVCSYIEISGGGTNYKTEEGKRQPGILAKGRLPHLQEIRP